MARIYQELRDRLRADPAYHAQAEVEKRFIRAMLDLTARGERRGLTPERLAAMLALSDEDFERVERLEDVPVETLAAYVRALGGELELRAVFPDGAITLPFGAIDLSTTNVSAPRVG